MQPSLKLSAVMRRGAEIVGDSRRKPNTRGYITTRRGTYVFDPIACAYIGSSNSPNQRAAHILSLVKTATTEFIAETITAAINSELPSLFAHNRKLHFVKRDVFTEIVRMYDLAGDNVLAIADRLEAVGL